LLTIAMMAVALTACRGQAAKTTDYAGQIENSKAFIGIATNGTDMLAYVCDGTDAGVTIAEWFKGTITDKSYELTSKGDARLRGQISDSSATGTLTLADGSAFSFSAPLAAGDAGLYRHEETKAGAPAITGWVVLNDGDIRGAYVFGGGALPPPPPPGPGGGLGGVGYITYIHIYYYQFP
jgi:hypothetical protein